MPQRGTLFIFGGVPFILAGIFGLKFTGMDLCWALIALGAVISAYGAISVSLSTTPMKYPSKKHS
ncbi:MAG: hypothetical protein EOP08_00865 [Proteobacteria bacterium]|nr:MAG: hypothetical protein EOP08_00865 [Pseudomonadota bacterium]